MSSYISFIYSLDDKDPLFQSLNKSKKDILYSYQNASKGQYATLIKGILTIASGDINKGSNIVLEGFKNIDTDDASVSTAMHTLDNSLKIIYPHITTVNTYDVGIKWQDEKEFLIDKIDSKALNSGDIIKPGSKIIYINGQYPDMKLLEGENGSYVKITVAKLSFKDYILWINDINHAYYYYAKKQDYMLKRVVPKSYKIYEYYTFPNAVLKNGYSLNSYNEATNINRQYEAGILKYNRELQ